VSHFHQYYMDASVFLGRPYVAAKSCGCEHACMCVMCECMTHTHTHTIPMHAPTHQCMRPHTRIHTHTCMHTHAHSHIHTFTQKHTHMHTPTHRYCTRHIPTIFGAISRRLAAPKSFRNFSNSAFCFSSFSLAYDLKRKYNRHTL